MSIQIQKKRFEIHDYDQRIAAMMRTIRTELSPKNSEFILKYDREMVQTSLAKATRRKHLEVLLIQTRMLNKDWDQATKNDIDNLVYEIMQKYSDDGKETNCTADHKKVLKIFYRWLKLGSREHRIVGDPIETKNIVTKPIKSKITREHLLTEEDLEKLLRACNGNLRDRALIHVQYEAGTRAGELLSLKLKHVKFDQYGAFIYVDGKTGARPVRLVVSVPSLAAWCNSHPFREDPESPLWIKTDKNHYGEAMSWATANKIVKSVAKRARLTKKITLKLFRHSEATESAKFLNETQMRIRHGWSPTSKMPAIYVHAVNADVDNAYLKHLGLLKEDEKKQQLPKICHICKTPNSPDAQICNSCGKPLDVKTAVELEKKANLMSNKLAAKFLIQMLTTGQIPKVSKEELEMMIESLNL
jgi:site-specific recombinase XerD